MSPDTMDTNTAARVCAGVKALSVLVSLVLVWMFPESRLCPGSLDFCEYFQPYRHCGTLKKSLPKALN